MNKLDLTKKVTTRDGRPVEIKFTDGRGEYPVVGYVDGLQTLHTWTAQGDLDHRVGPLKGDLINAPEWKLPDPPEGYKWHRNDWTEEMLPDGWRPMLVGECIQYKDEMGGRNQSWVKITTRVGEIIDCTLQSHYRTKAPLPPPKPKLQEVPLCADDIKAGDEFLPPDGKRRQWQRMNDDCISFVWVSASWKELKEDGWKIRSIGETEWRKCSKMQEVKP